jgi:hypothetical protein
MDNGKAGSDDKSAGGGLTGAAGFVTLATAMKSIFAIGLLAVSLCAAQAQALYTNISVKISLTLNQYTETTSVLHVPAGVIAEFVSFRKAGGGWYVSPSVTEVLDGSNFILASYGSGDTNPAFTNLVVGPCRLELGHRVFGAGATTGHCVWTFRLTSYLGGSGFAPASNGGLPSTAVVIPTDATGPVQIVLESSTDLVNWNAASPGTYGATTSNRFFRVRAVALPP